MYFCSLINCQDAIDTKHNRAGIPVLLCAFDSKTVCLYRRGRLGARVYETYSISSIAREYRSWNNNLQLSFCINSVYFIRINRAISTTIIASTRLRIKLKRIINQCSLIIIDGTKGTSHSLPVLVAITLRGMMTGHKAKHSRITVSLELRREW